MTARLREHALLSLLVASTRVALSLAGFPPALSLDWLFFADPADLEHRLGTSLVYFHLYPPGMNLIAGSWLKLGGSRALATLWFSGLGLVLANSLFFLLRELKTKATFACAVTVGFALAPATLFFERSFTDTYPAAVLVTLSAALLCRCWKHPSVAAWTGFFSACAALALLRSTFHLIWFLAVFAVVVLFQKRDARASALRGALGPLLVLLVPYLKNLALFGFFAPGSHSTFASHALTNRVASTEKATLIERGVLSPLAALPVYAPPRAYEPYFVAPPPSSPALLTSYDRPTIGAPNYNHRFLLDARHVAQKDVLSAIRERPLRYGALVLQTVGTFLGPSTRYHPHDKSESSPHRSHRRLLGGYESLYDTVVHRFPFRPVGLYLLLPLPLVWAIRRARSLGRDGRPAERAEAAVLFYSVFTIAFIAGITLPFASTEAARFRYAVEPLIWLVVALSLTPALDRFLTRLRARSGTEEPSYRVTLTERRKPTTLERS